MSLLGILNIGGSGLAAQQAALNVTGNNLANAANPNYTRETVDQSDAPDSLSNTGLLLGNGVNVNSVQRQVNQALNESLRASDSSAASAGTLQNWSGQVQSAFNALSGSGLSDQLNSFFNDWSTLAGNPADTGQRQVVVQDGQNLATTFNTLASNLNGIGTQVQSSLTQAVQQVNQLTSQIAGLNVEIEQAQTTGAQPNSLLDQRDATLSQLSQFVNIQTINRNDGTVSVYLGSEPLVEESSSESLTSTTTNTNGQINVSINYQNGASANASITGGTLGGLVTSQSLVDTTTDSLNSLASNLISSLNGLYSSGQGLQGYTSVTGTNTVADPTQPLTAEDLPTTPTSGSFVIHLTDSTTGQPVTAESIPITETGSAGDTTLNSLAASLNGVSGVQATVTNGQLTIASTDPNVQISFSGDTSGVLAGLGINTFFSGTNASDISVNSVAADNPSTVATAANSNPDDNTTALAISQLANTAQSGLGGISLQQSYTNLVQNVGSSVAQATSDATAAQTVNQTLSAQQQSLSGVSTDQEALNMIIEQRTYQGAAQLISIVNTMLQTLLSIT